MGDREGLTPKFRTMPDFATDMRAVIGLIVKKFNKPRHAVGHSNGAIAAAFVATLSESAIDSCVLVSPTHTRLAGGEMVSSVRYGKPVVIVENGEDTCMYSPASGVEGLAKSISAPRVSVVWVENGKTPLGGTVECHGDSTSNPAVNTDAPRRGFARAAVAGYLDR